MILAMVAESPTTSCKYRVRVFRCFCNFCSARMVPLCCINTMHTSIIYYGTV